MAEGSQTCSASEQRLTNELSGSHSLQRLSTRLIPEQSPEALYDQILETAVELMGADAASMQLLDDDGKRLRRVATLNLHRDSTEYWTWVDATHASTCGQALSKNERVVVEDVETSPELVGTGDLDAFRASGTRAVQSTPLLTRTGRPIGMISTHWRAPRRIEESDFGLFDVLARQIADLFERSKAQAVLREGEERQAFLLALGDAMRAESSADGKIAAAARLLGEKLGASRVLYAEYDHEKGLAYIFNGWLADGAQPFPAVVKLDDFEGDVLNDLRQGRVVRVEDVGRLGAESGCAAIANVGVQALLSPPLLVDGTLKFNVSIHQHEPRRWTDDEVALVQEVSERLWAEIVRARAEEALRASEEKYRTLFETMGQGYCELELVRDEQGRAVDQLYLELNPAFERLFGIAVADAKGRKVSEVFPFVDPFWHESFDEVASTGTYKRFEHQHGPLQPWFEVFAYPAGGDRVIVLYDEITDRKRAEEALRQSERHAQILLAELQHRVRNTLAVIRSIARRTADNSTSADEMLAHFQGRLDAFSRVQAALTRNAEGRVDLMSIVEDELIAHASHGGEQVQITGPEILLKPKMAERLSLAVHELTTNAVKYGALVNGDGRIQISWAKEQNGAGEQFVLHWTESGVDADAEKASHEGFGMELLRRSLPYDLGGETKVDLTPQGLRFELRMPFPNGSDLTKVKTEA